MRSSISLFVVVGIASLLGGCAKSAPPPGQVVTVEQVCGGADGSRVRLTGYLRYPRGMLSFCSTFGAHPTCDLELYRDPAAPADFDLLHPRTGPDPVSAKLSVPVGTRTGEMRNPCHPTRDKVHEIPPDASDVDSQRLLGVLGFELQGRPT